MENINIPIDTSEALSIIQEGVELGAEDGAVDSEQAWQRLQQVAAEFLEEKKIADEEYRIKMKQLTQKSKQYIDHPEQIANEKTQIGLERIRRRYTAAFKFDDELTKYRGELPKKAVFVYTSATGVPRTIEMSMLDLIDYMDKHGRIYQNVGLLFADQSKELELEMAKKVGDIHVKTAQAAYAGTVNRLNRFYEHAGGGQKQWGLLMWKEGRQWALARVANFGVVKEGYVAALMAKHQSDLDVLCGIGIGSPDYYSDGLIKQFFWTYLSGVTNRPAIIEEDVITDDAQYAVKGNKAAAPGITQYMNTAKFIVSSPNQLSKEELTNYLLERFDRNVHLAAFKGTVDDTSNAFLNPMFDALEHQIGPTKPVKLF